MPVGKCGVRMSSRNINFAHEKIHHQQRNVLQSLFISTRLNDRSISVVFLIEPFNYATFSHVKRK